MFSFDTEDDSKGHVKIITFFNGRKHWTFRGKGCQGKAIAFLVNRSETPDEFFATNLEYDLINTFGVFYTGLLTLWYTSSGLMRAQLGKLRFYDTLRHWPMSVLEAGKYIGLPKITDRGFGVDRCRRDAEITYKLTEIMLERYREIGLDLKSTVSSTAFNYWLHNFCTVPIYVRPDVRRFLEPSMYGGRCEIFRLGEVDRPVWDYDINSCYAFAMREALFPNLQKFKIIVRPRRLPKDLDSVVGVAFCKVKHPKTYLGFLPYRSGGKLLFPVGEFWGVWTLTELSYAVSLGVKVTDINYVVAFEPCLNPFINFVEFIYQKRKDSTDKFMTDIYKKLLNCVYGKFAERGHLRIWRNGKETVRDQPPFWSNVIFSSVVNSTARISLLKYLYQAQKDVCYCDTDGFVTTSEVGEKSLSKELGGLRLIGSHKRATFILPKLYMLGSDVVRCKGVPQKLAKEFIREGRICYEEPLSFMEAQKRVGGKPNVWMEREKNLNAEYTKRTVLSFGRTRPKVVHDG